MTKMTTGYSISYNNDAATLVMTKAFAHKAGMYGTAEYKTVMAIRKDMPEIKMVVESKAKGGNDRGMTYKNMRTVISQFTDSEKRMVEFDRICALSKIQPSPYAYVKKWFEANYSEIELDENGNPVVKSTETEQKAEESKTELQVVKGSEEDAA